MRFFAFFRNDSILLGHVYDTFLVRFCSGNSRCTMVFIFIGKKKIRERFDSNSNDKNLTNQLQEENKMESWFFL